ncbi:TVP38/TMEM64 family protein [Megasphaera sp. SW808]|uniref:TVP38/TMEM64 family protein n=1 Tax=Megasphaera sp. SW808 TaxID=2530045 RepID=UPI00143B0CA3|nr:VTT domain-containing protein [Megasphaera sp. SW808]NJE35043.1 TVP38/TMEM64 family protein [Megasphaera sp. SW808]
MTDKALGWTLRIGGVAGVILILWLIQVMLPDFYSTMWWLMIRGDLDGLTDYIASFGYAAIGVSVFMIAFVNAIGIPSIPFLTVNGIIFGLVPGILISWIGEVIGIEISFRLTRTLLRNQAKKVICRSNMLEKLDSYSCIRTIMVGRAIPYSPNVVVTAFSALSHISYRDHFIANALGKIPAVVVEVWLGHDLLRIQEHWGRLLILLVAVAAVYGFIWWQKKHRRGR